MASSLLVVLQVVEVVAISRAVVVSLVPPVVAICEPALRLVCPSNLFADSALLVVFVCSALPVVKATVRNPAPTCLSTV
jgi:hypothetical protein